MTRSSGFGKSRNRRPLSCAECQRRKQKCDRRLPCSNCVLRGKEFLCAYAKEALGKNVAFQSTRTTAKNTFAQESQNDKSRNVRLSLTAAGWGYTKQTNSTLELLENVESVDPSAAILSATSDASGHQQSHHVRATNVIHSYGDIVRELPPAKPTQVLLDMFMESFNWQYGVIEPEIFHQQLDQWRKVPVTVRASPDQENASLDMLAFPAILLQMIATALLLVSEMPSRPDLVDMPWPGEVSTSVCLHMAEGYSEMGTRICALLGKDALSLTTVQSQILRAAFQKYTCNVKGSWHTIAEATRDAQELGMHSDSLDPLAVNRDADSIIATQWIVQRRRIAYMLLVTWDTNMSVFMGRPGITNLYDNLPTAPVDTSCPNTVPVTPRQKDKEPPKPLSKSILLYQIAVLLRQVSELAGDCIHPESWAKVDQIHRQLLSLQASTLAELRLTQPDTRWDDLPQLHWLKGMRHYLGQIFHFAIMSLHRRYMFHREQSRAETLTSSLAMLELQRETFALLPASSWRSHMLFYGTFDALVQVSAVCILFPGHYYQLHSHLNEHFDWVIERFSLITMQNAAAGTAVKVLGVLRAIVAKVPLKISSTLHERQQNGPETQVSLVSFNPAVATPDCNVNRQAQRLMSLGDEAHCGEDTGIGLRAVSVAEDWPPLEFSTSLTVEGFSIPEDHRATPEETLDDVDLRIRELAPVQPTHDLLFSNVTATPQGGYNNDTSMQADSFDSIVGGDEDYSMWYFDGDIGTNTMWYYFNQI